MTVVLDASTVLAVVFDEPGGEQVVSRLDGAAMSVVNLAEVIARHVDVGVGADGVARDLAALGIHLASMTVEDAELQARIRAEDMAATGGHPTLSLADRACLALGMRMGVPVLTADRSWLDLELSVEVEPIR